MFMVMYVLTTILIVMVVVYAVCGKVITFINLYRLSRGKVRIVTSLREYIKSFKEDT